MRISTEAVLIIFLCRFVPESDLDGLVRIVDDGAGPLLDLLLGLFRYDRSKGG